MSEDNIYQDADIVWVKLRSCWWPGEVCSQNRQPEGLLKHTKRKPYCVVKFFQEESFEYVKNAKMILPFNCSKKDDFIRKGHALLAKNKYMEQFPAAVSTAERLTRSVTRSSLFFNSRPNSIIKAILTESTPQSDRIRNGRRCEIVDKILNTTPTTGGATEPSLTPETSPTYKCSICDFQSTRQNVMVLHRRSHGSSGTTPNRSSLINRSIINSSNAKEIQKPREDIKQDIKTPNASVKKVTDETPVSGQTNLSPTSVNNGNTIQNKLESIKLNTNSNTTVDEKHSQKEPSDSACTTFIRPPPKKQLSFITCKSESIQKSLLADWIDEDKDDEDEDEDENEEKEKNKHTKETQALDVIPPFYQSNLNNSISLASTSNSAEKLRNQETVEQPTPVILMEPQKPTSKIRNIPKKDRRNIIFTDFDQSDDISHVGSLSQKPTSDVLSYLPTFEEKKSSILEPPHSIEIPLPVTVNSEPKIEEPIKSKINEEEIISSKILTRGQRDKAKQIDEECHSPKSSKKAKPSSRKSTRLEAKILEARVEVTPPVDINSVKITSSQATDLDAIFVEKTTKEDDHIDATPLTTSEEGPTDPIEATTLEEEKDTVKTVLDESHFKESVCLMQLRGNSNLGSPKATVKEKEMDPTFTVKPQKGVPIVVETKIEEPATRKPTALKSTTEEATEEEPTATKKKKKKSRVYNSITEPIVATPIYSEQNTEQPAPVELIELESTIVEPTISEPTTLEATRIEQASFEETIIEPTSIEQTTLEQTTLELSTDEPTEINSTTVEATPVDQTLVDSFKVDIIPVKTDVVKPSVEKQSVVEPTTESTAIEPSSIIEPIPAESTCEATTVYSNIEEHTTVENTAVEPSTVEPPTEEPSVLETLTEETSILEPSTEEPTTAEPTPVETTPVEPTVEPTPEEPTTIEPSVVPTTVEPTIVEPATVEPATVEISAAEQSAVESTIVDPSTVEPSSVEPTPVEPTPVELTPVEPTAVEPMILEPSTVKTTTEEPTTLEPSVVPTTLEPTIVEHTIVEPTPVEPTVEFTTEQDALLESTIVEPTTEEADTVETTSLEEKENTVEPNTEEATTEEPLTVQVTTQEPTMGEPEDSSMKEATTEDANRVEPTTVEPVKEDATIKEATTTVESTIEEPTIEESATEEHTTKPSTKELSTDENSTAEPLAWESATKESTSEETVTDESFEVASPMASNNFVTGEPLANVISTAEPNQDELMIAERTTEDEKTEQLSMFQTNTDEPCLAESSSMNIFAPTPPSLDSTAGEQNKQTIEVALKSETELEVEPNESVSNTDTILEFSTIETPVSSKKPSTKKASSKKITTKELKSKTPILVAEREDENKLSLLEEQFKSDEIPQQNNSQIDPEYGISEDKEQTVDVPSKSKNSAAMKKPLKEKTPALRSSTRRVCKRDAFESQDNTPKKKMNKTSAKKLKSNETPSSELKLADGSFIDTGNAELTGEDTTAVDQSSLNQQPMEEKQSENETTELHEAQTPFQPASEIGKTNISESSTAEPYSFDESEATPTDQIPKAKRAKLMQSTESKPHVPAYLEQESAKSVPDSNEYKPRSSFSKASLACFDFNEEEDILTSIANFKKTYVSPEKSYNFSLDSQPKTPDDQKLEMELKDQQLSADIESLLKTTTLPVNLGSSTSSASHSRPLSNEVRGLPIKERGKRIFKSRNRFRVESCPSVTTTSTTEVKPLGSTVTSQVLDKKETIQTEIRKSVESISDANKQDPPPENVKASNVESIAEVAKEIEEKTITTDDKVTNSGDEIIGRIVFPPSEVYAPSDEHSLTESVQIEKSQVSSSDMEVNTESLPANNEDASVLKYTSKDTEEMSVEKVQTVSCETEGEIPSHIENPGDENKDPTEEESKQEHSSISFGFDSGIDQQDTKTDDNDRRQSDDEETKQLINNQFEEVDNVEYDPEVSETQEISDLPEQEDEAKEISGGDSEIIYDKEECTDDQIEKANYSSCELPFEYELVTTEVSTIVDHIPNEEHIFENAKESSAEVSEEVVSCCDDGTFLNEMIIADVTESQSSIPETEIDNSNLILKYSETEQCIIENPTDESNSCSMNGTNSKIYSNEETDIHVVSNVEDESRQAEVERLETSSDDSSTIISDAEAEFGSPTSMLEEERVFNRARSGSDTPATSAEGKAHRTLKKSTRKTRYQLESTLKENKLLIQSLQCDTQESVSNDIVSELVYDTKTYESESKECASSEPEQFWVEKESILNESVEENPTIKETDLQETTDLLEATKETPINDKDFVDSNYENSDSSEEEEEEICSPPIEPLLDEDTELEAIENYSTSTSLSKSESGHQPIEFEVKVPTDTQYDLDNSENCQTKDKTSDASNESEITQPEKDDSNLELNEKQNQSNTYYTITQKSDTIIKLNKQKEKMKHDTISVGKDWIETNVDVRKSDLAGEELSAAEALLLIPNQPTNVLENQTDLITKSEDSPSSLTTSEETNTVPLLTEDEIKEEIDCTEPIADKILEQNVKGEIPKELIRRKRRSHMKVTPRKRIIEEIKQEKNLDEPHVEAKILKISNTPKLSGSKSFVETSVNPVVDKKTHAEQYEDNFVLKYMKDQLTEDMDSVESTKSNTAVSDKSAAANQAEKQTLEKVHITVDISNPLSSQIATILGTNRPSPTEIPSRAGTRKRKQTVEDDIPSFIIKRPCPKTTAEEEAADRETIAQIQNLCPHVEITRKSSKDDQNTSSTTTSHQTTTKPQIINQQILRTGNNQPTFTVTAKSKKSEEPVFDISNMPIVLSNEKIMNEKVHLVITPTTNPQIIKQFQSQQQMLASTGTTVGSFSGTNTANVSNPGIPVRRSSCVRTKRTPSRQQLPDQQQVPETHNFEQENYQQQQQLNIQQQPNLQQEFAQQQQQQQQQQLQQQHHHQIQQQQQQQQEHNQLQQQQQRQVQLQSQTQFQQHHQLQHQQQQQQQQQHIQQQQQIQQQLQEEQNILMQQHHQLLLQQQLQLQQHQHQQQLQSQQQLITNEKASQSSISEKQIGMDNRGNKYVIIRNPTNTVVMANSPEPCKVQQQQRIPGAVESLDQNLQRKQRKKKQSPLTVQTTGPVKSPIPIIPPLPGTTPPPNTLSIKPTQTNQPQPQYFKEQTLASPNIPVMSAAIPTKPKGRGRGRPPKNKVESVASIKQQNTTNNVKSSSNGRRSSGRVCEPRQRSTRTVGETTSNELHHSAAMTSTAVYTTNQQQTRSVDFVMDPQYPSMSMRSSPSIRANNDSYQAQTLSLSSQSGPPTAAGPPPIDASEVSGGGYAVPSLPVPGYPQTYLLCELIGNKYKEVYSKPLYLSADRTKFLEVPEELVTEAHKKLSDSRREPNPNALKLMSQGMPQILQSRLTDINSETIVNQNEHQQNEVLMQKQLSAEDQASALLCLQEQIVQEQLTQEHLAHEQISQEQLVQEHLTQEQLVQEQFVEEQFVQEQFGHEQFVPEQFVQEQFVQEQFGQEQFVQEQFVQDQFVQEQFGQEQFNLQPQQYTLQLGRYESGDAIEDPVRGHMLVINIGSHSLILDDKAFFEFTGEKRTDLYNAEKDTYVLTPQIISNLLHQYTLGNVTAVPAGPAYQTGIGGQNEVSIADVIQNADSSSNILEVALDDSGLYSEEQFINSDGILQIETPDGMQLIGTAAENADLIFHHMAKANTNETNVLLNQAPKMSAVEVPSDKSKQRFETKPSTPATLEDCLNVIGVPIQSPTVPTSLELPASVTNPAIVAKTRTPTPGTITMNEIIATGLCHHPDITSLPSMGSNDQELSYEFFPSRTEAHVDKDHVNEESVVTDMGEYAVVSSSGGFDDPGR